MKKKQTILHFITYALFIIVFLAACDQHPTVSSSSTGQMPKRQYDAKELQTGKNLFAENCAQCHGENAQGAPDWHKRNADGTFPPPPLNGTGHAWHHSSEVLFDMIHNGSKPGEGNMPAWKDKLDRKQIELVIQWFQSMWPDPLYAAWYEQHQRM
jgi:mono/diheme cytochrome c family protein